MNNPSRRYWFPAKRFGWGWGLPTAWQGWVVLLVYAAIIAVLIWRVPPSSYPSLFCGSVVIVSLLLVMVCWLKGEPPSWHWGD